jgi:Flp pilus assembly protein TadG
MRRLGHRLLRGRRVACERGQAVVELSLILPIVLLLIFGLVEFGKAFNYWIDMTHLANEGSRYASVNRWPGCPDDQTQDCSPDTTLQTFLKNETNTTELKNGGTGNVPNPVSVSFCYPADTGVAGTAGQPIRVAVDTKYQLPIVNGLLKFFSFSPDVAEIHLKATSTVRLEQVPTSKRVLAGGVPPAC